MLVGIPASGKSTYAKELEAKGAKIFSSDERRERFGETNPAEIFPALRREVVETLKNGDDAVLDATNMNRKKRIVFLDEARKAGATTRCDLFVVPPSECAKRNAARKNDHGVTDEVIKSFVRRFECPWYSDGFDEIAVHAFQGEHEPEYDRNDLKGFPQDNRHHALPLLEHEKKAYDWLVRTKIFTDDFPFLLEAARYHDDGKFFTKSFLNFAGEETKDAHYYGHECVSSYMFLVRAFCDGQYENPDEYSLSEWGKLYVAFLISMHMRPLTAWKQSKTAMEKDRKRIGEQAFQDLVDLSAADEFASTDAPLSSVPIRKMNWRKPNGTPIELDLKNEEEGTLPDWF